MRQFLTRPVPFLTPTGWQIVAISGLLGLMAATMAWPLFWSPGGPYPVWMMVTVVPLLTPLRGLLHGRRRTAQWAAFLPLPYLGGSIASVYGYFGFPQYTTAADALGACAQGAAAGIMIVGCMYYAYATRGAG
mgnify:CR=1 FL=1